MKPDGYFDIGWRSVRPDGGPVLINLVHELDILRYMCGEIDQVFAQGRSKARGFEVEDSVSISITFRSGAVATIVGSDAVTAPWSYEATTGENPLYFNVPENCYYFTGTEGALAFPQMELWKYPDRDRRGWQHPMREVRRPRLARRLPDGSTRPLLRRGARNAPAACRCPRRRAFPCRCTRCS